MDIDPVSWAYHTANRGISAREGLRQFRAAEGAIRDATWFKLVAEAKASHAVAAIEATLPLYREPLPTEISPITSKVATGYMQYASVYLRDKDTGEIVLRHFGVRTDTLLTRQRVIARAIQAIKAGTTRQGNYANETVLGGIYASTHEFVPAVEEAA